MNKPTWTVLARLGAVAMLWPRVAGAAPVITISNPRPGAVLTNGVLTATGRALSDRPLTGVYYSFNGLPWATATGTTNWSVLGLMLTPGPNIFRAFAMDDGGASSATNLVRFTYPPSLTITRSGSSVTVSWPYPSSGFSLQQSTDLRTTNWTTSGFSITTNGSVNSVSITRPTDKLFFRLTSP